MPQNWGRGLIVSHKFSDRSEAYTELYDQQDANRIAAGQGGGNFATGLPKQRETTSGLGGRQALNQAKTLNLLLMDYTKSKNSTLTGGFHVSDVRDWSPKPPGDVRRVPRLVVGS